MYICITQTTDNVYYFSTLAVIPSLGISICVYLSPSLSEEDQRTKGLEVFCQQGKKYVHLYNTNH